LAIREDVSLVTFDARDRLSVRDALLTVLNCALNLALDGGEGVAATTPPERDRRPHYAAGWRLPNPRP
jgi:hypothetical protein